MTESPPKGAGDAILRVVIGTAGHIDHGKSSLVLRLTGIDPDRLPEEKQRGLTIDLGFANFRLSDGSRIGIVDVPGHERFVHNMVAGATGIDLALLVVAADDGVMPQTIEHLEILELLGIARGAIALTKIDLVTPELRELAADDVRQTVRGTFLESASIHPVSSTTGEGIEALRAGLERLARATAPRNAAGAFRMPIQRVFSVKGFGCVVTGIPLTGSLRVGDRVEVLPGGAAGSVRGLEAYHHGVEVVSAGHSSALNVAGLDAEHCARGMVAATPAVFEPVRWIEARLRHLPRRKRALRDRTTLRFHAGTMDVGATLCLLDRPELAPGDDALVQLRLDDPVVVAAGDRYLLRLPSPAATVGGGVVVGTSDRRARRRRDDVMSDLAAGESVLGDALAALRLAVQRSAEMPIKLATLARRVGRVEAEAATDLEKAIASGEVLRLRSGAVVGRAAFASARGRVEAFLADHFREHPERLVCERLALREGTHLDPALLDDVVADLGKHGRLAAEAGGGVRLPSPKSDLSPEQRALRDRVLARLQGARFQPPSREELLAELGVAKAALDSVLKRLVDEKAVARIGPEIYFASSVVEEAKAAIVRNCAKHVDRGGDGELDLPSLRDELRTTRRWLIPLVEWFDTTGFTTRLGSRRILKRR